MGCELDLVSILFGLRERLGGPCASTTHGTNLSEPPQSSVAEAIRSPRLQHRFPNRLLYRVVLVD